MSESDVGRELLRSTIAALSGRDVVEVASAVHALMESRFGVRRAAVGLVATAGTAPGDVFRHVERSAGIDPAASERDLRVFLDPDGAASWPGERDGERVTVLGSPITVEGAVLGSMLVELEPPAGDDSTTRATMTKLAVTASVALAHVLRQEQASVRARWMRAGSEVTTAILGAGSVDAAFGIVVDELQRIAHVDQVFVTVLPGGLVDSAPEVIVRAVSGAVLDVPVGVRLPLETMIARDVFTTGRTLVVPHLASSDDAQVQRALRDHPKNVATFEAVVVAPMRTPTGVVGALTLFWMPESMDAFRSLDVEVAERFANQAAVAMQVAQARADRARLTLFERRERIGRDLHDSVIQRLFAVGLGLQNSSRISTDATTTELLVDAVAEVDAVIRDIRTSIHGMPDRG